MEKVHNTKWKINIRKTSYFFRFLCPFRWSTYFVNRVIVYFTLLNLQTFHCQTFIFMLEDRDPGLNQIHSFFLLNLSLIPFKLITNFGRNFSSFEILVASFCWHWIPVGTNAKLNILRTCTSV